MTETVPLSHGLILAAMLFCLGVAGLLARRNIIVMLLSVEVMLNGAALAFIVAGAYWSSAEGQVMFLFILAMAAAEVAVGLAIALELHREFKSLDSDAVSRMKG